MGPSTPPWSSQSCAVFVSVVVLALLGRYLGNFKKDCCFGILFWFGCPLSFWPCSFICLVLVRGTSVDCFFFFSPLSLSLEETKISNRPHAHAHTHWNGRGGGALVVASILPPLFSLGLVFSLHLCDCASSAAILAALQTILRDPL